MDYLVLVNKFEPSDPSFAEGLQLCEAGGKLFEKQTAAMLDKMISAAADDGVIISVISGYRSEEYQQLLWERDISREMGQGLDYESAKAKVGQTLALPGCSEHSTGLAADLGTEHAEDVEPELYKTPVGKWLCANAADFGFILRYPRMKEHLTGISYEPWHYRYVGREAAKLMTENGICLEEFLPFYSDKFTNC